MYTLEDETNFFDDFHDIFSGEKHTVRCGKKHLKKPVPISQKKFTRKLMKRCSKCIKRSVRTKEFDCLADKNSKVKKMIKAPTGEKISTSTTGNKKSQKRQYKSKQSVYSKKDCNSEKGHDEDNYLAKNVEWLD